MGSAPTFLDGFLATLERGPDRPAFTFLPDGTGDGLTWTYTDLHQRAGAVASRLREVVSPGQTVMLMAAPGLDYLGGFFGCLYANAIAVPAYPPSPFHNRDNLSRLHAVAADARTSFGLVTADLHDAVAPLEFAGKPVQWISLDDESVLAAGEGEPRVDPRLPEDIAFLQYTSGSTGNPKGVMVGQGNLHCNILQLQAAYDFRPGERTVNWVPPYHDMGLIGMLLSGVMLGLHGIFMPPAAFLRHPVRWLDALSRFGGAVSAAPNFSYDVCVGKVRDEDLESLDLSQWRCAINGAEPVRAATLERFAKRFAQCGFRSSAFYPSFGMAETTVLTAVGALGKDAAIIDVDKAAMNEDRLVLVEPGSEGSRQIVTCGRVPEGTGIKVVDPATGEEVGPLEIGEFVITGPHVTQGYWQNPEATAERFDGDTVRTGDLGTLVDGQVAVTGRLKDLMIIRGRNYYPNDIEQTAEGAHEALRPGNAAAFTVDGEDDEELVVVVEIVPAKLGDGDEVVDHVRRAITTVHGITPGRVVLLLPGRLPKTSSGKIRRRETRRLVTSGEIEPVLEWSAS